MQPINSSLNNQKDVRFKAIMIKEKPDMKLIHKLNVAQDHYGKEVLPVGNGFIEEAGEHVRIGYPKTTKLEKEINEKFLGGQGIIISADRAKKLWQDAKQRACDLLNIAFAD